MLRAICKAVSSKQLWMFNSQKLRYFEIFNMVILLKDNPAG